MKIGGHKKIDLFVNGKYYTSTNSYRTCLQAVIGLKKTDKEYFIDKTVKAFFDHTKRG